MRERVALYGLAAAICVAVLAPLAAPGYVLAFDMVFVPRQPLRWDLVAPADVLPRSVPLDAVVSLVTQVVPGWLVQRFALVAVLAVAAVGAGRLVPADRLPIRLGAALGYAWTPYLAERLLIGHWALLLGYAALPWLVQAVLRLRAGRPGALARVVLAAAPAVLTPTGGLIAFGVTAALVPGRGVPRRPAILAVLAVAALNLPWLVASVTTTAGGSSDPLGVPAFAARAENWSGVLGALAGTGGIWNAQTTPGSRASGLVPVATLALLALAVAGYPVLRRRWAGVAAGRYANGDDAPDVGVGGGVAGRFAGIAAVGFLLASAGALPVLRDGLAWLVVAVPGAGLLRDGQKFLMPYALFLVLCAALGAQRLAGRLAAVPAAAGAVLLGFLLLPVATLPDLGYGVAGRLRPVHYPADWDIVAARVAEQPGPVLSLPLSAYRNYPWNPGSVVLDPLPRYLPAEVVVDDTLVVGDLAVAGENSRAGGIRRLVGSGAPVARSGVRWVVVQRDAAGPVAGETLAGLHVVYSGPELTLYANPQFGLDDTSPARADRSVWTWRRWLAAGAGTLALGITLAALVALGIRAVSRLGRHPTPW
ncbi:hypothetical protein Pen02_34860 [Plantactinospora endophytica]|uniref:DUF3367 domain-containing protein n=1 Tax=Plantactinospora endophytica TaxID=673535 RepID=A0ABQ4E1F8_9ACTN|nr:hypothetical protein Pen02_34860 [Plantactinospora endophytica]